MKFRRIAPILMLTGLLSILILTESKAQSKNDNFGLGLMIGEPTGVSIKKWLSERTAFDIGAAWSLNDFETLHLHSDFLIHTPFDDNPGLTFYYGAGVRVLFAKDPGVGIRAPLGLSYQFDSIPFDLFLEAVPILNLTPYISLAGNGAIGMRYYL
ncbi:MAG TPA: hypothetical protein DEQ34_05650 [Balneolaceae bacterium]|nr:hypothetical protein [Balneolaceae bacterium]|tara:strand:- start:36551 stop:37015 length:465 start_codon:yes stop_codon:yes gene_type:complete